MDILKIQTLAKSIFKIKKITYPRKVFRFPDPNLNRILNILQLRILFNHIRSLHVNVIKIVMLNVLLTHTDGLNRLDSEL